MDIHVRAYDDVQLQRAESLPIQRLKILLESGGLRDRTIHAEGLTAHLDPWSRETVVARLEALMQEGWSDETLSQLRGTSRPVLITLRHRTWPALGSGEGVALREDLVRYLTYGLWSAPADKAAHALSVLTGEPEQALLLSQQGDEISVRGSLERIGAVDVDQVSRSSAAVRSMLAGGGRGDEKRVSAELERLRALLLPATVLLSAASRSGLRVIIYRDASSDTGLTEYLARELSRDGQPTD